MGRSQTEQQQVVIGNNKNVLLLKVGGSSITEKSKLETLNIEALKWFSRTVKLSINDDFLSDNNDDDNDNDYNKNKNKNDNKPAMIIVHGAGSFGHHTAKKYGLRGETSPPPNNGMKLKKDMITGIAKTRLSVKKLNNSIVSYLIEEGVNAVGISPCMNIPGLMTHGGNEYNGVTLLVHAIRETLSAGLVPVIHGDAGLYGTYHNRNNDGDGSSIDNDNIMFQHQSMSGGILGGDTLVEIIATHPLMNECISKTIFLTDVPGVYTKDPNIYHDDAMLVRNIDIDPITGKVMNEDIVSASGSLHEHDVTGGLEAKLGAAVSVAKTGIDVIITKCCSPSAKIAMGSSNSNSTSDEIISKDTASNNNNNNNDYDSTVIRRSIAL